MRTEPNRNKFNPVGPIIFIFFILLGIKPILGVIFAVALVIFIKKNPKFLTSLFADFLKMAAKSSDSLPKNNQNNVNPQIQQILEKNEQLNLPTAISNEVFVRTRLEKRKKYLHIALNSTLEEAGEIISRLPSSNRILIEAGTPLIKIYGTDAVSRIKAMAPAGTYIVADNKCADLAAREVEMMANAGASAATCLGVAPTETIDSFISECQKFNLDSIIDMMNVPNAVSVLKELKKLPDVVMLHRGVDESEFSKEKQIPYYQIKQIKGSYNILVAVAGGDTIKEVERAIFNGADIVVVWKSFYQSNADTAALAKSFLGEIK
jgi:3-keto-L-gulonate-6-phosphate decarboxylase